MPKLCNASTLWRCVSICRSVAPCIKDNMLQLRCLLLVWGAGQWALAQAGLTAKFSAAARPEGQDTRVLDKDGTVLWEEIGSTQMTRPEVPYSSSTLHPTPLFVPHAPFLPHLPFTGPCMTCLFPAFPLLGCVRSAALPHRMLAVYTLLLCYLLTPEVIWASSSFLLHASCISTSRHQKHSSVVSSEHSDHDTF